MKHPLNSSVTTGIIQSSLSPTYSFNDYQVKYPQVVTDALCKIYDECNKAFGSLVKANREWPTDYRYCYQNGNPINWIVQIDMCGLPSELLDELAIMKIEEVQTILKRRIFEMENNWALYQLLSKACETDNQSTLYSKETKLMMQDLRTKHSLPIALLAVTKEKYVAMKAAEFGKGSEDSISDEEVLHLSGFDAFFGPDEFLQHLSSNGGKCGYLLYVRSSDPIEKLKRPETVVEHPLLSDSAIRRIIKEYSITFNVDNPAWQETDERRINDTKRYLPLMGMGFEVKDEASLMYLSEFSKYLEIAGIDSLLSINGTEKRIRAKPIQGTFGCYGHISGSLNDGNFRKKLRQNMRSRGSYILQPEHEAPQLVNEMDQHTYAYIDRVFIATVNGVSKWIGGHRECLSIDSHEVNSGRLHGNSHTIYAEIC